MIIQRAINRWCARTGLKRIRTSVSKPFRKNIHSFQTTLMDPPQKDKKSKSKKDEIYLSTPECDIVILEVQDGVPIYKTSRCPIKFSSIPPQTIKETIPDLPCAFTLHNVLTPQECLQFVSITEKMGYDLARITTSTGMVEATGIRNNKRMMWHTDGDIWQPIYKRISQFMDNNVLIQRPSRNGGNTVWNPYGMNERFRFYRYSKGETFKPHYDGQFPRGDGDMSLLTFIIYLNDDFEGGCTTFFQRNKDPIAVKPKQGSALVFWHGSHPESPLHEGSTCNGGTKYVLRSDVMYKRK